MNKTPFDLATLDTSARAEAGFDLAIEHPVTREPLGIVITVAGKDSTIYRKAIAAQTRKGIGRTKRDIPHEDMRINACRLLAACTLHWSCVTLDGEELPCTPENAAAVYQRFPWLFEQVDEAIHDRANLLRD